MVFLKSFLSKLWVCLELGEKSQKTAKKSTKTVPRRHCLLWFYYFSILHLFQTNLVRCRCINLLSFFFPQLNNSVTKFVQTSIVWPQAPEYPSFRLLQEIKSCISPKDFLFLLFLSPQKALFTERVLSASMSCLTGKH